MIHTQVTHTHTHIHDATYIYIRMYVCMYVYIYISRYVNTRKGENSGDLNSVNIQYAYIYPNDVHI